MILVTEERDSEDLLGKSKIPKRETNSQDQILIVMMHQTSQMI